MRVQDYQDHPLLALVFSFLLLSKTRLLFREIRLPVKLTQHSGTDLQIIPTAPINN